MKKFKISVKLSLTFVFLSISFLSNAQEVYGPSRNAKADVADRNISAEDFLPPAPPEAEQNLPKLSEEQIESSLIGKTPIKELGISKIKENAIFGPPLKIEEIKEEDSRSDIEIGNQINSSELVKDKTEIVIEKAKQVDEEVKGEVKNEVKKTNELTNIEDVFQANEEFKIADGEDVDEIIKIKPEILRLGDYLKFQFNSEREFDINVSIRGNSLYLDFNRPNDIDFFSLIDNLDELKSIGTSSENLQVTLNFNNEIEKVRKFLGDNNTVGFDLFLDKKKLAERKKYKIMTGLPDDVIDFFDSFIGPETPTEETVKTGKNYTKIITYPKAFIGPPKIDQIVSFNPDIVGPLEYDPFQYAVFEVSKKYGQNILAPEIMVDESLATVTFPLELDEKVGTAAFLDKDKIHLIFEGNKKFFKPEIIKNNFVDSVTRKKIDDKNFTHIEVKLAKKATKQKIKSIFYQNKLGWVLEIAREADAKDYTVIDIRSGFENKLGEKRIFFKSKKIKGPYLYQNEVTGSIYKIFTIHENGVGISNSRELVDVKLNKTLQGISLYERSDFISYKLEDEDRLLITKLPNLQISEEAIASGQISDIASGVGRSRTSGVFPEQSIFPFPKALETKIKKRIEEEKAKGNKKAAEELMEQAKDDGNFLDKGFEYFNKIAAAKKADKSDMKLELGKYYFSKGLYSEASGVLKDIFLTDAKYKKIYEVKYILAATYFLTHKYDNAYRSFTDLVEQSKNNRSYNELKLWRYFSKYMENKENRIDDDIGLEIDFVSSFDKFMQQYDDYNLLNFGKMYIHKKLDEGKYSEAKDLLETITYRGVPDKLKHDYELIYAEIAKFENDNEKAKEIYEKLTKLTDERESRARALFKLANLKLKLGEYSRTEAINDILRASVIWRDDYFEIDTLNRVAELYEQAKDYAKALDNLKKISVNFTDTAENIFVLAKMKDIFVKLFDEGAAYELPPLEALKIYFKYRELTPIGFIGDRITKKVSEFFAEVDMVDEAIKIVEHQIKYRAKGDEKARLTLWLSDTLTENREHEKAFNILQKLNTNNINLELENAVNYKKAMITAEMGKLNKALQMIKGDNSVDANRVRIEVFWQRENWFGLIRLMEEFRIDEIKGTIPENLTRKEVTDILRLAVAYSAQNMKDRLKELKESFISRVASKYDEEVFEYLTTPRLNLDYQQFSKTLQMDKIEDYLKKFSFMENNHWQSVIDILAPRAKELVGKSAEDLSDKQKKDIVRLALAYAMKKPVDGKDEVETKKAYSNLTRNFRDIFVDRFTIDVFSVLDSKAFPKEADAVFEGKIKLSEIPDFVDYYKQVKKISLLNISIRGRFK